MVAWNLKLHLSSEFYIEIYLVGNSIAGPVCLLVGVVRSRGPRDHSRAELHALDSEAVRACACRLSAGLSVFFLGRDGGPNVDHGQAGRVKVSSELGRDRDAFRRVIAHIRILLLLL